MPPNQLQLFFEAKHTKSRSKKEVLESIMAVYEDDPEMKELFEQATAISEKIKAGKSRLAPSMVDLLAELDQAKDLLKEADNQLVAAAVVALTKGEKVEVLKDGNRFQAILSAKFEKIG